METGSLSVGRYPHPDNFNFSNWDQPVYSLQLFGMVVDGRELPLIWDVDYKCFDNFLFLDLRYVPVAAYVQHNRQYDYWLTPAM